MSDRLTIYYSVEDCGDGSAYAKGVKKLVKDLVARNLAARERK